MMKRLNDILFIVMCAAFGIFVFFGAGIPKNVQEAQQCRELEGDYHWTFWADDALVLKLQGHLDENAQVREIEERQENHVFWSIEAFSAIPMAVDGNQLKKVYIKFDENPNIGAQSEDFFRSYPEIKGKSESMLYVRLLEILRMQGITNGLGFLCIALFIINGALFLFRTGRHNQSVSIFTMQGLHSRLR